MQAARVSYHLTVGHAARILFWWAFCSGFFWSALRPR